MASESTTAMTVEESTARKKSWVAWLQTFSGFISQIIASSATSTYTMAIALIAATFGVTAADLAIGTAVYGGALAALSFVWGNLADRIGLRISISVAAAGVGVCFIGVAVFATDVVSLTLLLGCAGAFAGGVNSATLSKSIAVWFHESWRGKGMILVNMGGNVVNILMGLFAPFVLEDGGWQMLYQVMGVIYIVVGILLFLMLRDAPEAIGAIPFGSPKGTLPKIYVKKVKEEVSAEEKAAARAKKNKEMIEALKHPTTWKFGLVYIFWQLQANANRTFMVAAVVAAGAVNGMGWTTADGGALMALFTTGMLFGMPLISFAGDYLPRKWVFGVAMLIDAACFFGLWIAFGTGDMNMMRVIFPILGFFTGTVGISWVLMAECYPPNMRGTGPGVVSTTGIVGRVGGALLAAWVINTFFAGYTAGYTVFAAVMMLVAGVLAIVLLPMTSGKYGDPLADKYYKENPSEAPQNYKCKDGTVLNPAEEG